MSSDDTMRFAENLDEAFDFATVHAARRLDLAFWAGFSGMPPPAERKQPGTFGEWLMAQNLGSSRRADA